MERFAHRGRNLSFVIVVLTFLLMIPLATLLLPKSDRSTIENRSLASVPKYSQESLFSGEYFLAWEDYFKDHIAAAVDVNFTFLVDMHLMLIELVGQIE